MTTDAQDAVLAMATRRAPNGTACPSEVARALAAASTSGDDGEWRSIMPIVHAAVDRLVADGQVQLSWKGQMLDTRAGPYRIRRVGSGEQE